MFGSEQINLLASDHCDQALTHENDVMMKSSLGHGLMGLFWPDLGCPAASAAPTNGPIVCGCMWLCRYVAEIPIEKNMAAPLSKNFTENYRTINTCKVSIFNMACCEW